MSVGKKNPCSALERIFHEPSRLAIMSALIGNIEGLSFNALKEECELTDGNLSRHLKALEEFGAILISKAFVHKRPRTTVSITDEGQEQFMEYLKALEEVLKKAATLIPTPTPQEDHSVNLPWWKTSSI